MLIIGRAIAGVGASGISSGAYVILSATVPLEKRPAMLGLLMGMDLSLEVHSQQATLGDGVSGIECMRQSEILMTLEGFYINLPLGSLVAVPLLFVRIPDQVVKKHPISVLRNLHHRIDLLGFALFAPAVVQLLLALQFGGNQFAWSSSQVIGLFCGAGATFIVWIAWNYYKGDDALLPFPIIRRKAVWTSGVNYAFMMATVFGSTYFLPIYFQAVKGVNAIMSGWYLGLRSKLSDVPNVNADAIIAAGATRFRGIVSTQELPRVLVGFSNSLDDTFYLQAAAGVIAWVAAWGMGWKDIRKKKETPLEQPEKSDSKPQDGNNVGGSEQEKSSG
ncbi:MAG: hypothetical protein Q9227_001066 [Pyrenula ochraceoflavens]